MSRRVGLRFPIVVALSAAFVAALALLAVAGLRLEARSREQARVQEAQRVARLLAEVLRDGERDADFEQLAELAVEGGSVAGIERGTWRRGEQRGAAVEAAAGASPLRVWARRGEASPAFSNLLLLYVAVTGGSILVLTYLALTVLVVRPIERMRLASGRLAAGNLAVRLPLQGTREVVALSRSFNEMAEQLGSERAALEDRLAELERTTKELGQAQTQVLRSARLASVGRLSAGVAHEIGNPLAAIAGLVEVVRAGQIGERERDEFLARVQSETERIHRIIRDLLDFARQGDDEDRGARSDLAESIGDAVRLLAPQRDTAAVRIEQRLAPVPPVRGSADRWVQVVLNLLLNAIDAVDGEGTVVIALSHEGEQAVLRVTDSGPGIAPGVRTQLFEPFVTTKPSGRGTGLGLAVCHTLVEQFGGSIQAEDAAGSGARFVVRVPTCRGADAPGRSGG